MRITELWLSRQTRVWQLKHKLQVWAVLQVSGQSRDPKRSAYQRKYTINLHNNLNMYFEWTMQPKL